MNFHRTAPAVLASLLVASLALSLGAVAQVNPYVLPSISLTPTSGTIGTTITITGTGFSAGVGIHCSLAPPSGGSPLVSGFGDTSASSNGGFTETGSISAGSSGSWTITCSGSDLSTNPHDTASGTFTLSGVTSSQVTTISSITATSQTITVNNAATTGATVTVTGLPAGTTGVAISTTSITAPSKGNPAPPSAPSGTVYVDVHISLPPGTAATGTANVCVSNPNVNSGWTLEYYDNGWQTAQDITFPSGQVCGNIPVSALTGTNVAAIPGTPSTSIYLYLGAFVVVIIIIIIAAIFLRRRGAGMKAPAATK